MYAAMRGGVMKHWIGFDVGKRFHWLCVLDEEGDVLLSRRVDATEGRLEAACSEIASLGAAEERVIGLDMVGGPATLLEAILLERGERVRYIPGTAVNRARDACPGGEHKSDPKDAFVIADQLRLRWRSLRGIRVRGEGMVELRALVGYRRNLVQDQRRRVCRLRELLSQVFPGLEAALPDLAEKGALLTVAKAALPSDARRLGRSRLARWLKARGSRKSEALAEKAVTAAEAQRREMPAAGVKAALVSEIAWEILRAKERISRPREAARGVGGGRARWGDRQEHAGHGARADGRVPGGGGRHRPLRVARPLRRGGGRRPRAQGVGKPLSPAESEKGQQGAEESLLPVGVLRDRPPPEKQRLLPAKAGRRQSASSGGDSARSP